MSLSSNIWFLSLVISATVFVIFYLQSHKIVKLFSERTMGTQEEILSIMDKLLISQDSKKFKRNSWFMSLGLSFVVFLLLWPNVILSVVGFAGVFLGFWYVLKRIFQILWEQHCNKVVDQMVEGLTIMCNSLKVGLSLAQAMDRVIKGSSGPLSKEFGLVLNKMQLGQSLEESFEEMAERVQRSEVDMLVSTVNILKETGGNLAETFYVMSETLREGQKMQKKIKALTAQGVMQAKIISFLPFGLLGVFYVMDREYVSPLFFQPLGWVCLGIMLVLVIVGSFVMRKMVEIKV